MAVGTESLRRMSIDAGNFEVFFCSEIESPTAAGSQRGADSAVEQGGVALEDDSRNSAQGSNYGSESSPKLDASQELQASATPLDDLSPSSCTSPTSPSRPLYEESTAEDSVDAVQLAT